MILSIGVGLLMICGEYDLSVGGVFVLAPSLTGITFHEDGWPLWASLVLALAGAVVVGTLNGLITLRLRVPSFITTLGMMFFLRGVVRFAASSGSGTGIKKQELFPGETFEAALTGQIVGPLHAQLLWVIGIAVFAYLLLSRHRLGNHFFAVGGNREAAVSCGIPLNRVKITGFILCSCLAAIAGIFSATRLNGASPETMLVGLELQAIAACVIGGVFLFGGRGTVVGMVLGAALIVTVDDILALIRAPGEYFKFFIGAVIVFAAVLNTFVARRIVR
jgi:simple sugar transport system permease protein